MSEDYTYDPVAHVAVRADSLEGLLAEVQRLRAQVAEEIKRAELAEAQLACVDDYGIYAETQGQLYAPVYLFADWYRSPFRNPKAPQP